MFAVGSSPVNDPQLLVKGAPWALTPPRQVTEERKRITPDELCPPGVPHREQLEHTLLPDQKCLTLGGFSV